MSDLRPELLAEADKYSAQIDLEVTQTDDELYELFTRRLAYLLRVRGESRSGMGGDDAHMVAEALVRDHVDLISHMLNERLSLLQINKYVQEREMMNP